MLSCDVTHRHTSLSEWSKFAVNSKHALCQDSLAELHIVNTNDTRTQSVTMETWRPWSEPTPRCATGRLEKKGQ